VVTVNKCPFFEASVYLGEANHSPKYQIVFPTITPHQLVSTCLSELIFQIRDIERDRCTGAIRKENNYSCQLELCSNATLYHIEFPLGASPMDKLLIITAVEVIDQNFFNKKFSVGSYKGLLCGLLPLFCIL
jgi:hypothetical protein